MDLCYHVVTTSIRLMRMIWMALAESCLFNSAGRYWTASLVLHPTVAMVNDCSRSASVDMVTG